MSLIAVGSARAAPGATTLALALAATWPSSRAVLVWEADADGGVLAARYNLGDQPGLATIAATVRQGRLSREQLWQHTQQLPGGTPVVVGGESADQSHVVLTDVAGRLAEWLQQHPSLDVIADVGRVSPSSPAVEIAETADVTLMVARPLLEELRSAVYRLHALAAGGGTVGWVLVGRGPYSIAEVRESFGLPVFAEIPNDERAATALVHGGSSKALRRSMLMRAARGLADELVDRLGPQTPDATSATPHRADDLQETPTAAVEVT